MMDLPAAYLASRWVGVPFYTYIWDHYSYREIADPARQFWAKRFEPIILRGATGVIVTNEVLGADLHRHYGIDATVIHNSFDISPYRDILAEVRITNNDGYKIVYTGEIYDAHYDAFHNLLAAIKQLGRTDVKLHIYTHQSPEDLSQVNICGPIVWHKFQAPSEMPRIQCQANILFLPLAFNSPYPDLVRTSATTKLGEYLAARRPILVHAPTDSFVTWYFRKHQCGMVVDQNDPNAVAQALEQLLFNREIQDKLAERVWERAQIDFNISEARAKFMELIGGRSH